MASPAFGNIVSSFGLKSNGFSAIDVIAGIPVRISHYQGNPTVYIYAGDKENARSLAAAMNDSAKNMGIMAPKASGESITFGFKKPRLAVDHYDKIRELITANSGQFSNLDKCPYCFMGNCDVAGMYKGATARKMHRQCFLNHRNSEMDKIEHAEGNYFTGILCAVIAAALIVALLAVIAIGANKYYPFLCLIFPILVGGAFRLGKGPYGPMGTFCHVTVSILAMYAFFYSIGCYRASLMYRVTMVEAIPYFGDIMGIITDPQFMKDCAPFIVLFIIGLLIACFASPTSKKEGRKNVQQNDVFITPLSSVNTGFTGYDTYNPFGNTSTQNPTAEYNTSYGNQDPYGNQNTYGTQNTYGSQNTSTDQSAQTGTQAGSGWVDVYAQHSDNNNNNGSGA